MKAKEKSLAIGILLSISLGVIGTVLTFYVKYYLYPSHAWILPNGAQDEIARKLSFNNAVGPAFAVGAVLAVVTFLFWIVFKNQRSSKSKDG